MRYYISILYKFFLTLALLIITQMGFYFLNKSLFNIDSYSELISIIIGSLKFGIASVIVYLFPYLVLSILPLQLRMNKYYRNTQEFFYILGTEIILVINLIDIGYYRFTFKRITYDFFNYLGVGGDFNELIPQFLRDYWHIVVFFILLNILFSFLNTLINKKYSGIYNFGRAKWYIRNSIFFVLGALFIILGLRGGLQLRPLSLIQANNYATSQNTPLVLNSPFTLYRTFGKVGIEPVEYFKDEKEIAKYFSPLIKPENNGFDTLFTSTLELGKTNVVVIILESFSAEYMSFYKDEDSISYTPFLDSLARKSIVFDGYANGKRSIDALPSILSSLPLLMNETYITSQYNANNISSFANLLKPYGYLSSFFHGGYNGSMGFDAFTKNIGYQDYYGRNEYGNDKDYDGNWGIFDEPFLSYMVDELDKYKEPFNTGVFTLSSHHPYTIPSQHIGRFPKGTMIVHETVGYTDYALRKFFEKAEKKPWFKNTLFIITSDHSAQNQEKEFKTLLGSFRIPIIFYHPKIKTPYYNKSYMQQIDILPTALSLINYPKPIVSFGQNQLSDKEKHYVLYLNDEYILRIGDYLSRYRIGSEIELFYLPKDINAKENIAGKKPDIANKHSNITKAIIQEYNTRMIENKFIP